MKKLLALLPLLFITTAAFAQVTFKQMSATLPPMDHGFVPITETIPGLAAIILAIAAGWAACTDPPPVAAPVPRTESNAWSLAGIGIFLMLAPILYRLAFRSGSDLLMAPVLTIGMPIGCVMLAKALARAGRALAAGKRGGRFWRCLPLAAAALAMGLLSYVL